MASNPTDAPMLALISTPDIPAPTIDDQARIVLLSRDHADDFIGRLKQQAADHVADTSTKKGRDATIAFARKFVTTKTTITDCAKAMTEEWRQQTAVVNAARKPLEAELSALAAEVRRPVTEWEAAEAARVERNRAVIAGLREAGIVTPDDTAASVEDRGRRIHDQVAPEGMDALEHAAFGYTKADTVKALVAARDRLRQEEADRAELARLRQEAAERAEREAAEQAERDRIAAAERAKREARELEEARQREADAAAQREADRIAEAERAAEQRARDEAERVAQAERDKVRAEHEAALQVERDRVAAIDLERESQIREIRRQEDERVALAASHQAERDRIAAEDAKRAANRAHVGKVMGAAKVAIMSCGVTEDQAKAIVTAIKAGLVPQVEIKF